MRKFSLPLVGLVLVILTLVGTPAKTAAADAGPGILQTMSLLNAARAANVYAWKAHYYDQTATSLYSAASSASSAGTALLRRGDRRGAARALEEAQALSNLADYYYGCARRFDNGVWSTLISQVPLPQSIAAAVNKALGSFYVGYLAGGCH